MRNRLVHGYRDVDRDVVWDAVAADLPALVGIIERFLTQDDTDDA